MNWAEEEFKTMEFGDARLDRRAGLLAEQLSQRMRSPPGGLWLRGGVGGGATVAAHAITPGGAVPARHHRAGLPGPGHRRPGAAELRSPARAVPATDLRRHARARAAGADQFVELGARVQARGRRSAPGNAGERALARRLRASAGSGRADVPDLAG